MARNIENPQTHRLTEEVRYAMDVLISNRIEETRFKALLQKRRK
jgi:hypothetical protein